MTLITKELFVEVIESVRIQLVQDAEYSNNLANVLKLGEDGVPVYNNTLLIRSLLKLLQVYFPKKDGFCAIEHYMFEINFGNVGTEQDLITIDDLWYELTKNG
jgi:hypothetical protein